MDVPIYSGQQRPVSGKGRRRVNSRLSKEKLSENGFELLPAWQDALGRFFKRNPNT